MQLVDSGQMNLDHKLPVLVDEFLHRSMNTSIEKLWGAGPIVNVTLGQILSMRSGVQDYNDTYLWEITMEHPQRDITPFDFVRMVDKSFVCLPGSCGYYSSINFILAGFVLAQHQNLTRLV
jgi:CubicO group peptidase (beta-lactamase class C family)